MATIAASDNEFPKVLLAEGAAAATPDTGLVVVYAKADGKVYSKDDAGTETELAAASAALAAHLADTSDAHDASAISVLDTGAHFTGTDVEAVLDELFDAIGGASGNVAADAIWDAAGDLAVGSGSNTAARLAKGAAGANLSSYNGVVSWNGGTAFPASPASGDRYWRSDLGLEFFYDGTRWLSSQLVTTAYTARDTNTFPMSANGSMVGAAPYALTSTAWLVGTQFICLVNTTNSGSAYWTIAPSHGSSFTTAADGVATAKTHYVAVGSAVTLADLYFYFSATKTSSPGTLMVAGTSFWRYIAT